MRISLKELFSHSQYTNRPVYYYFDKKTYTICDINSLDHQQNLPYIRYIPLFQVDEEAIQQEYILRFMGKRAWRKFQESSVCFEAFMQTNNEWNSWWRFYQQTVYALIKQWCNDNHIVFEE